MSGYAHVRNGSRLCENVRERRTSRNIFSIAFSRHKLSVRLISEINETETEFLRAILISEFSHSLGQNAKYSERADDFRLAAKNGHRQARTLCPFRAKKRHARII